MTAPIPPTPDAPDERPVPARDELALALWKCHHLAVHGMGDGSVTWWTLQPVERSWWIKAARSLLDAYDIAPRGWTADFIASVGRVQDERDQLRARAVSAEQELAGLRERVEALAEQVARWHNTEHERVFTGRSGPEMRDALRRVYENLRAALAEPGGQAGEKCTCGSVPSPDCAIHFRDADLDIAAHPAPVVPDPDTHMDTHMDTPAVQVDPDSADVREPFVGYLAEHVREAEGRLHNKYQVRRLADPSGKHSECRYFVLDPQRDEHAATALRAYAEAVRSDLPDLAADLDAWVGIAVVRPAVTGEVTNPLIALAEDIEFVQGFYERWKPPARVNAQYRAEKERVAAIHALWDGAHGGMNFYPSSAVALRHLAEHYRPAPSTTTEGN